MSYRASGWAAQQTVGSGAAKAVLLVLAEAADDAGFTFLGHEEIARRAELTRRTVITAMKLLEGVGAISRRKRWSGGFRTSDGITLAIGEALSPELGEAAAPEAPAHVQSTTCSGENDCTENVANFTVTSQEPVTNQPEGERACGRASPKVKVKAHPLPEGFPSADLIARAQAKFTSAGVRVDAAAEAEKFADHHGARGTVFVDWSRAFLGTWCGRAIDYAKRDGRILPRIVAATEPTEADAWAGRMQRWERAGYWDVIGWGPKPGQPGCRAPADVVPLRRAAG